MPTLGEPGGPPAPFGDKPRKESIGEAERRLGGWGLALWKWFWKCFGVNYDGPRYEDDAADIVRPLIKRWPWLAKWKAPKLP